MNIISILAPIAVQTKLLVRKRKETAIDGVSSEGNFMVGGWDKMDENKDVPQKG